MRTTSALLLFLSCCAFAAHAGDTTVVGKSESTAVLDTRTADSCAPTLREHFTRYAIYHLHSRPAAGHALITQTFDIGSGCFEGFNPAKVTVEAAPIDARTGRIGKSRLWSFSTEGVSGEVQTSLLWGLYRIQMPGCCGSAETAKYFSLETGKTVVSTTGRLLEANFSGHREALGVTGRRFVGVEDNIASSPHAKTRAIATIYFGDANGLRQSVAVNAPAALEKNEWWLADVGFTGGDPTRDNIVVGDGKTVGVHIHLRCRCDAKDVDIVLPFGFDGVDEKAATITGPDGVVLVKSIANP